MTRAVRWRVWATTPLLSGLIFFTLAYLCNALTRHGDALATIWLANGAIIALLLGRSTRTWLRALVGAGVGAIAAGLAAGDSLALSIGLALSNLLEVAIVAHAYRRRFGPSRAPASHQRVEALAGFAVVAPLVATPLAALALIHSAGEAGAALLAHRTIAHVLGNVVLIPLMLALVDRDETAPRASPIEAALLTLLAGAATAWSFAEPVAALFLLAPLLVFAAIRLHLGQLGILVGMTFVTAMLLLGIAPALLPDQAFWGNPQERSLFIQAFMIAVAILTLPVYVQRRERARAAEVLARREAQYRLLADHGSDIVMCLSRDGLADHVSSASQRMLGLAPPLLLGRGLTRFIHPADRSVFHAALRRACEEGAAVAPFRMLHNDGHQLWVEASFRLAADAVPGAAVCPVVAALRDVHARRIAEIGAARASNQLHHRNRQLTMAEELAALGHWTLDDSLTALALSPGAMAMLGVDQPFVPVKEVLDRVCPSDLRPLRRALAGARRSDAPVDCRIRIDGPAGERTIELRALALPGPGEAHLFGVASDITAKLESERRLLAAVAEARAAADFRSQFLATMSHEIRTPMTGVLGMVDLLESESDPEEARRYLRTLRHSGELLMAVLNDVLDFSKIDAGLITLDASPFDPAEMVQAVADLFTPVAEARGLRLVVDCPLPGRHWLSGDPVRLRQVLGNLLSNAIKFGGSGTVMLRATCTPADDGGICLWLSVSDQGPGMALEECARLFEPFVQGRVGAGSGGTGLGLAISRRLITAMAGTIALRSEPGHGTTVEIDLTLPRAAAAAARRKSTAPRLAAPAPRLPAADAKDGKRVPPAAAAASSSSSPGPPAPARSLRILLAEDNPVNQMLVVALCRRWGHLVQRTDNGDAACALAARTPYDLILMDLQMPRCDGPTAARRIRAGRGLNAGVPIIALTADTSRDLSLLAADGFDAVLTKPIDPERLGATLAAHARPAESAHSRLHDRTASAAAATSDHPPALLEETLDELGRTLGEDRLCHLLRLLAAEIEQRPRLIRAALAVNDHTGAAAAAHSLKGAAANLGALGVSEAARAVEAAIARAAEGRSRALAAALRALDLAASMAATAIAERLEQAVPADAVA